MEDIRNVVYSMNTDCSPGSNGFNGKFYQTFGDVVEKDVCEGVWWFF